LTLTIAAIGKEIVVVGVDSRGTFSYPESPLSIGVDRMDKLKKIANHVCILTAGSGEFGESLIEEFRGAVDTEGLDGASTIFHKFRGFCIEKWIDWFSPAKVPPPIVHFIIAGLDKDDKDQYKIPSIYSLNSAFGFAPQSYKHGFSSGGIDFLAIYLLNNWYSMSMERADLCPLIAHIISETALIDGRVGGKIRVAAIEQNSTIDTLELAEDDVNLMIQEKKEEISKVFRPVE